MRDDMTGGSGDPAREPATSSPRELRQAAADMREPEDARRARGADDQRTAERQDATADAQQEAAAALDESAATLRAGAEDLREARERLAGIRAESQRLETEVRALAEDVGQTRATVRRTDPLDVSDDRGTRR